MGYGDEVVAAGQAQRLWDTTGCRTLICDQHGRPRWHPLWEGNPAIVAPSLGKWAEDGERVQELKSAPECRPYIVYPFTPETGWTFNKDFRCRDHVAKIYLTPDETRIGTDCRERHGRYILIEPWSKHPNLRWPMAHWESLVGSIRRRLPGIAVIQHTHKDSVNFVASEAIPHRSTTWRETCGLLASADCYIRGESGLLHAAAALGIPSVAIWGGCMDWDVMGGYPKQVGVGVRPPACGSWKACDHCAQIMAAITPEDVMEGLEKTLCNLPARPVGQSA